MNNFSNFLRCIKMHPQAAADMKGNEYYPDIRGRVLFYNARRRFGSSRDYGTSASARRL